MSEPSRILDLFSDLYSINEDYVLGRLQRRQGTHKFTMGELFPQEVIEKARCCFVLSTGRCGTKLITKILSKDKKLKVLHQPKPELVYLSKLIYQNVDNEEYCKGAALHSRYDFIRDCYLRDLIFVETNNRITFYAPFIYQKFAQSKFIHLIRNPAAFVRSGLRRGYYSHLDLLEGRLVPRRDDPVHSVWLQMSQIEKIAWLWNETNQYIENFKKKIPNDRVITVYSEKLFSDIAVSKNIFEFIGTGFVLSEKWIQKTISKPVNVQKSGDILAYDNWTIEQKEQLKRWVPLASDYGYVL